MPKKNETNDVAPVPSKPRRTRLFHGREEWPDRMPDVRHDIPGGGVAIEILGGEGKAEMFLDVPDWDFLKVHQPRWQRSPSGDSCFVSSGTAASARLAQSVGLKSQPSAGDDRAEGWHQNTVLARALLVPEPHEDVFYLNDNPLDLRRANLEIGLKSERAERNANIRQFEETARALLAEDNT
jgi:hypothetical protein